MCIASLGLRVHVLVQCQPMDNSRRRSGGQTSLRSSRHQPAPKTFATTNSIKDGCAQALLPGCLPRPRPRPLAPTPDCPHVSTRRRNAAARIRSLGAASTGRACDEIAMANLCVQRTRGGTAGAAREHISFVGQRALCALLRPPWPPTSNRHERAHPQSRAPLAAAQPHHSPASRTPSAPPRMVCITSETQTRRWLPIPVRPVRPHCDSLHAWTPDQLTVLGSAVAGVGQRNSATMADPPNQGECCTQTGQHAGVACRWLAPCAPSKRR